MRNPLNSSTIDVRYFDNAWSPNQGYIGGYTWADGTISRRRDVVCYRCATEDEEVILKIREEVKSEHQVTRKLAYVDKTGINHGPSTVCKMSNSYFVKTMAEKFRIVPAKSEVNPAWPNHIPDELMPAFVRGYFDGDGWAFSTYPGLGYKGSERFILGLQDYLVLKVGVPKLKPYHRETTVQIIWQAMEDVRKLYDFMYIEGVDMYMSRKKHILEQQLGLPLSGDLLIESLPESHKYSFKYR